MAKKYSLILSYILAHFIVDFACAFLMFSKIYHTENWYLSFLLYNFCAFALQMPFGLLADRFNHNAVCAAAGCVIVAISYGFGDMLTAAVIMAGIGNGLFHVGGGIDVLNISQKSPILLGIFVSPGAFGIYLGTQMGKSGAPFTLLIISVLIMSSAVIMAFQYAGHRSFSSDNSPFSIGDAISPNALLSICCLLAVVCLRSYVGMISNFPWKGNGYYGILLVLFVFLGKTMGGIVTIKFGSIKASVLSLGLASILFLFAGSPIPGIAAVFFFNMSMPITLWALAKILTGCKGFSFGLLTFGLFLGYVPAYLGFHQLFSTSLGLTAAALASLTLLLLGLRKEVA